MKLIILHNIATSYYKNIVFNALYEQYEDFKLIHLAETQSNRDWEVDLSYLEYPHEVLFRGNLDKVSKFKLIVKLLRTLNKENFDIVYLGGYSEFAYWIALLYSKIKKKTVILEMDSNRYNIGKKRFYKVLFKKIFVKLCDYGITYGALSKAYFMFLGMSENRIIIKPNVTDNEYWINEAIKYKNKRLEIIKFEGLKENNFIYVGRFSKEKNLFFLLKAFYELKQETESENWGLILLGGGPLEIDLKEFVRNKNIKDVFFIPFKQKEELPKYYSISDVLVLPSLSETWGIVVNEAMASGLIPVISKRCGALNIITDSNGFLFEPTEINELIAIMKNIINNEISVGLLKKEVGNSVKKFTAESSAGKIIELIELIRTNKIGNE